MHKVKDIMTGDPVFCVPDTDLKTVASLMCQHDCGEIPVVESASNKKPIGVITDRDITCRSVAQGKDPLRLKASDCMTGNPVTCRLETPIDECVKLLERHQIRRLPVVDRQGLLCGIVAQADIARKESSRTSAEVLKEVSQPVASGR